MLSLEAARLIGRHLRRAIHYGHDEEAREGMMLGATLAGAAFSNASVALVHGMSRPIGAHSTCRTASATRCCCRP